MNARLGACWQPLRGRQLQLSSRVRHQQRTASRAICFKPQLAWVQGREHGRVQDKGQGRGQDRGQDKGQGREQDRVQGRAQAKAQARAQEQRHRACCQQSAVRTRP